MCGKSDEKYFNIAGWILQTGTWLFLILFLVLHKTALLVIFILVYLLYLLIEFCSPTSSYLCNKSSHDGMYEKMREYFHTPPEIRWHLECFHYENHEHTKVSAGTGVGVEHYTSKEKVVTHSEDLNMSYYSARDISGIFVLNCDKALLKRKCYIKLELIAKIDFADPATARDYQYQKINFYNLNYGSDEYCSIKEERVIPDMEQYNLVKLVNDEPKSINFGLFFLFTMLTFVEFYKIYINSLCVYQKFDIKKIISTRYDLNLDQYVQMYQAFIPSVNLINVQYNYQPADYTYLNQDYNLNLPSQEEVENQLKNQNFDFENGFSGQNPNPHRNMQNGYSSQNLNPKINQNGYQSRNINQNGYKNQNTVGYPNQNVNSNINLNVNLNPNQNNYQMPTQNELNNNAGIEVNINNQPNPIFKNNNVSAKIISDDNCQSSERLNPKNIKENNENNETRVNIENNNEESFSPIILNKQEKK